MKPSMILALFALVVFQGIAVGAGFQDEPAQGIPGGTGGMIAWLISAAGLTFIAQLLRSLPIVIPGWARTLVGPLLGMLAGVISQSWGLVVDFGLIEGALLGTTSTFLFTAGKETGLLKSSTSR